MVIARNLSVDNQPSPSELFIGGQLADKKGIKVLLRGSNIKWGDATLVLPNGRRLRAEFKEFNPEVPFDKMDDKRIKRMFEGNIRYASDQMKRTYPSAVVLDTRALPLSDSSVISYINRSLHNVAPNRPNLQVVYAITNHGIVEVPVTRRN